VLSENKDDHGGILGPLALVNGRVTWNQNVQFAEAINSAVETLLT